MSRIVTDISDRVATITLNDPDRRNAFDLDLVDEMVTAMDAVESHQDVGAVVVTGAPPAFCAGADLSHLGSSEHEGLRAVYEGFLRVARSPLPTIAAVNGAAVGAGMNLALCCDLRMASPRAKFDTRFLQLGIHPGGGHTWMFRRVAGEQAAMACVLFGEVLDGNEAERVGLAWRCVPDDELLASSRALAAKAAAGPPELVAKLKATLHRMATVETHADAVDDELETQVWSIRQPAFAERLAALKAKIGGS